MVLRSPRLEITDTDFMEDVIHVEQSVELLLVIVKQEDVNELLGLLTKRRKRRDTLLCRGTMDGGVERKV